ncbi:MAG: hypothetical protein WCQ60_02495 [bacterium]
MNREKIANILCIVGGFVGLLGFAGFLYLFNSNLVSSVPTNEKWCVIIMKGPDVYATPAVCDVFNYGMIVFFVLMAVLVVAGLLIRKKK